MDWECNTTNKDDTSNSFPANRQIECITSRCKNNFSIKFTDLIGSGKVNSKGNTEAETSLTVGKYIENSVV
jgi:hypothetical protein